MSDDIPESEFTEEFENLGMEIEQIKHVTLIGGLQFVGEIIDDKEQPLMIFLNPVKILQDSWFDEEEGYNSHNIFVQFNPCVDEPFTFINPDVVISISTPNHMTLKFYLDAVKDHYYPENNLNEEKPELVIDVVPVKSNVIDFSKFLKK